MCRISFSTKYNDKAANDSKRKYSKVYGNQQNMEDITVSCVRCTSCQERQTKFVSKIKTSIRLGTVLARIFYSENLHIKKEMNDLIFAENKRERVNLREQESARHFN